MFIRRGIGLDGFCLLQRAALLTFECAAQRRARSDVRIVTFYTKGSQMAQPVTVTVFYTFIPLNVGLIHCPIENCKWCFTTGCAERCFFQMTHLTGP
jgi:hypothetical protein